MTKTAISLESPIGDNGFTVEDTLAAKTYDVDFEENIYSGNSVIQFKDEKLKSFITIYRTSKRKNFTI